MANKDFVVKNSLIVGDTATINGVQIDLSGASSNQVLKFDGTKFAPASEGDVSGTVYNSTIGDGTNSSFTITHGFGTRNVVVVIRNASSPYEVINARWEATTTNSITVDFSSPVTSNSIIVSVYSTVSGTSINALDDIADVTAPSPSSGDLLKWNGTAWVNASGYALLASPTFTGTPTIPTGTIATTQSAGNNTTAIATTAYVDAADALKANLASPALTGVPTAPTAAGGTNTTQVATTAFVADAVSTATGADTVQLGVDTTGSYVASLVAGTGVTLTNNSGETATPTIAIGQAVGTGSNVTFNNLTVAGNLTVSGTTTSINTETLTVDDNIVVLNNNATGSPTQNAGIEIERGSSTNVALRWNETDDKWQFTNDGSVYTDLGSSGAVISASAPNSPTAGQLWFDEDTAQTFVYYDSSWIEIGASGMAATISGTEPSSPIAGQVWFNSLTGGTYIYYGGVWVEVGVNKTSLPVSVSDYGAVGDGVTDDTNAFSNAAQARTGAVTFSDNGIQRANSVFVTVPDGNYVLSSRVDTGGRDVVWIVDRGAVILNSENLNGELLRQSQRIMQAPFGNEDNATGFAVRLYPNGTNFNDAAEVLGVTNETDISVYTDRDAVSVFADVFAPPPTLTLTSATYSATTVIPASAISAANIKLLRKGMIIDTAHSPTKYSGFITGWAANGSSITVEGWYLANGTVQSASTPSGTATAYVNPFTKVWAHNANVLMDSTSHASAMTGFELGLVDNKQASTAASGGSHYVWGFDAVNLGTYKVQSFFVARGSGFVGLRVDNADTGLYYTGGTNVFDSYISNERSALLRADGTMELGKQNTAATWYADIHTSGNNESVNDYDARIQVSGGTTTDGTATVTFFASNTDTQTLRPRTDDTYTLGGAARRWTTVYATTATINTSDEREKEQIGDIDEAVLRAWGNVNYQQFKFKDAVALKGSSARWHVGLVAQRVKEAFEAEGIDPFAYGILCYDEWDEQEEKTEEGVGVVQEFEAAGNRYGIRYEEALALECAYLRSRLI